MIGLTPIQAKTIEAIKALTVNGVSPTYREIAQNTGRHLAKVHATVGLLIERGHVRRIPGKARALEVIEPRTPLERYSTEALIAELHKRGIEA
jgi:SOS-response transcriptional repressor LexA